MNPEEVLRFLLPIAKKFQGRFQDRKLTNPFLCLTCLPLEVSGSLKILV